MMVRCDTWAGQWRREEQRIPDVNAVIQEVRRAARHSRRSPSRIWTAPWCRRTRPAAWSQTGSILAFSTHCRPREDVHLLGYSTIVKDEWRGPGRCTVLVKETKAERPTAALTVVYHVWSRTRKACAGEWCGARAGSGDDAVRGSSPLRGALRWLEQTRWCSTPRTRRLVQFFLMWTAFLTPSLCHSVWSAVTLLTLTDAGVR